MTCRICGNISNNTLYTAKEMLLGLRDEFEYIECGACGCLQIKEMPSAISRYYPTDYYSYQENVEHKHGMGIKKKAAILRDRYAVFNKGLAGRFLYNNKPRDDMRSLAYLNLKINSRILDVGCGSGLLVYDLKEMGFEEVHGVDPFISSDIYYVNGARIMKKTIDEVDGIWDLIMFHHSFEHLANPLETLTKVCKLLSSSCYCVIRIPTVTSYAWRHYGVNWFQLDAPRHFYLHSIKSIKLLAEMAGYDLEDVVYDSHENQFVGSELYLRDYDWINSNPDEIFSNKEIQDYKNKSLALNKQHQGDQAIFYLRKK